MGDLRAPLRMTQQLLWVLRRRGLIVSTAQALTAVQAAALVGFAEGPTLREALAAVLVTRPADRARFDAAFTAFFRRQSAPPSLDEALDALLPGDDAARATVRALVEAHLPPALGAVLFGGGAALTHRLAQADVQRALAGAAGLRTLGFYTHAARRIVGLGGAQAGAAALRRALVDALGAEAGDAVAAAVAAAVADAERALREAVTTLATLREPPPADGALTTPFAALSPDEAAAAREAVRALAARLEAAARARRRRARRVHVPKTLRRSLQTGGVPFRVIRRPPPRREPSLTLLCDLSDSVRAASRFLLEFCVAAQELLPAVRVLVFVAEVADVTEHLKAGRAAALDALAAGAVVPLAANSNYGRVFGALPRVASADPRGTLVILGDGRTNFLPDGRDALAAIVAGWRRVLWLCPEPQSRWGTGDSAMARYATIVTEVAPAVTAADLVVAARRLVQS